MPRVTTTVLTHGPEVEYLEDGVNARILRPSATPTEYAKEILSVLASPAQLGALSDGARKSAAIYTEEAMVRRFTDGIGRAISIPH